MKQVMFIMISAYKRCSVRLYLQLLVGGLIYLICVCFRIVVSDTYCVVFLLCLSSLCIPCFVCFSGLSIFFIASSVFSNVYLKTVESSYLELESFIPLDNNK